MPCESHAPVNETSKSDCTVRACAERKEINTKSNFTFELLFLPFLLGLYKFLPQVPNTTLTEEFPQLPHELVNEYHYRSSL